MKNILFIVGSLRQGSFNHQRAKTIERLGLLSQPPLCIKIVLVNSDLASQQRFEG